MAKRIQVAVEDEIKRLEALIANMESKYKMSSEAMAKAAWEDHSLDTHEVALWLTNARYLKMLRQKVAESAHGRTTGTLSKTT